MQHHQWHSPSCEVQVLSGSAKWLSCRAVQLEGSKQIQNRSRPTRNKTKKVIGGATDEEIAEHAARPRLPRPAAVRQLQRNRSKGKNGKMRVGSKHINDAAEALLGMGSGFVDDDGMVPFQHLLLAAPYVTRL